MVSELYNRADTARQQFARAMGSAVRSGQFRGLSEPAVWLKSHPDIEEQILRDGFFAGPLNKRFHKVAGRDWDVMPGEEGDPMAPLAIEVCKPLLRKIRKFTDARAALSQACFRGRRHSKIHGRPFPMTIGDGRPRTWMAPVRLEDQDARMFRQVTQVDEKTGRIDGFWQGFNLGKNDWQPLTEEEALATITHTYQDIQATLGHGSALRECLGWIWYAKTHTGQEVLQAIEKYASGITIAKIDNYRSAQASDTASVVMQNYVDELEDMRTRHIMAIDKEDEIEHSMPAGTGWELIKWFWGDIKTTALELILGSNLPTSANKGGSYALGDVQSDESNELIDHDREILEETLTDDLIQWIWSMNWPNIVELGLQNSMPRFAITQKKRTDPKEVADLVAVLSASGLPLSKSKIYEKTGMSPPESDEDTLKAPAPAAGQFPQLPGFGGQQGGFGQ